MEYDNCAHPRWTVERRMAEVLAWPLVSTDDQECDVTERMVMLTRKVVEAAHGLGMPWPNVCRGGDGVIVYWCGDVVRARSREHYRDVSVEVKDRVDGGGSVGCICFNAHIHSASLYVINTWNEATLRERMAVAATFWRGASLAWAYEQSGTYTGSAGYHPDRCNEFTSGPHTCNPYNWPKPTPLPREAVCRHG